MEDKATLIKTTILFVTIWAFIFASRQVIETNFTPDIVQHSKEDILYKEYLVLKAKMIEDNLKFSDTINHVPKDVIWNDLGRPQIIPMSNPLKKVFSPNHPHADHWGMIKLPNIDLEEQKQSLLEIKSAIGLLSNV